MLRTTAPVVVIGLAALFGVVLLAVAVRGGYRGIVFRRERPTPIGAVGVRIAGGGTLVFDALPASAARRGFRTAALAAAGGVFALGIVGVLAGVVPI